MNGLDSTLTLTVYHKTVIGKAEAVGVVHFPLRSQFGKKGTEWFPLGKKSTLTSSLTSSNPDKYRGEIQLKFEFSNKFSTSSMTLNTVHGNAFFLIIFFQRGMLSLFFCIFLMCCGLFFQSLVICSIFLVFSFILFYSPSFLSLLFFSNYMSTQLLCLLINAFRGWKIGVVET